MVSALFPARESLVSALFPARESLVMVSDIPAGDGEIANIFLTVCPILYPEKKDRYIIFGKEV